MVSCKEHCHQTERFAANHSVLIYKTWPNLKISLHIFFSFTGSPKCAKEQSVFGAGTEEEIPAKSPVSLPRVETPSEHANDETLELPQSLRNLEVDNNIHDLRTEFERSFIETDTERFENHGEIENINTISIVSNLSDVSNIDSEAAATLDRELPPPIMCRERENRLVMPAGPSRTDDLLARAAAGPRTK